MVARTACGFLRANASASAASISATKSTRIAGEAACRGDDRLNRSTAGSGCRPGDMAVHRQGGVADCVSVSVKSGLRLGCDKVQGSMRRHRPSAADQGSQEREATGPRRMRTLLRAIAIGEPDMECCLVRAADGLTPVGCMLVNRARDFSAQRSSNARAKIKLPLDRCKYMPHAQHHRPIVRVSVPSWRRLVGIGPVPSQGASILWAIPWCCRTRSRPLGKSARLAVGQGPA
jgi:hypothetical protein